MTNKILKRFYGVFTFLVFIFILCASTHADDAKLINGNGYLTDKIQSDIKMELIINHVSYGDVNAPSDNAMNLFLNKIPDGTSNLTKLSGFELLKKLTENIERWETGMDSDQFNDMLNNPIQFVDNEVRKLYEIHNIQDVYPDSTKEALEKLEDKILKSKFDLMMDMLDISSLGFNNINKEQMIELIELMKQNNLAPEYKKMERDNDTASIAKLNFDLSGKINPELAFSGKFSAVKRDAFANDSYNGFEKAELHHSDSIQIERAFVSYRKVLNQNNKVFMNFSLGRQPFMASLKEKVEPEPEYGQFDVFQNRKPFAPLVNWEIDGASVHFGTENFFGSEASFKLCYGQGYENDNEWNSTYWITKQPKLEDLRMMGFRASIYDKLFNFSLSCAYIPEVSDGFYGFTVMPFNTTRNNEGNYSFSLNPNGYILSSPSQTNIGNWLGVSLFGEYRSENTQIFTSISLSQTQSKNISTNPFYELLGHGLLSSDHLLENTSGVCFYAGISLKNLFLLRDSIGIEWNYGSENWLNFSNNDNSYMGNKLATRGQVYELYYAIPVYKGRSIESFYIVLDAEYYKYDYTGSGNPLGKPVKIDEATIFDSVTPEIDNLINASLSIVMSF